MDRTVAVLYKDALAYYSIHSEREGSYSATLLRYNGDARNKPPQTFTSNKEGRHWTDDTIDQELLDQIGFDLELQRQQENQRY